MKQHLYLIPFVCSFIFVIDIHPGLAQKLKEDFNRANSSTIGQGWTENGGNAEINSDFLQLNTGGTQQTDYVVQNMESDFQTFLDSNSTKMTWYFNMRQSRGNPSGFGSGSYGVAFVLGSTNSDFSSSGKGYAVVLGETGSNDALKLGHFNGGLNGTNGIDGKILGSNGPNNGFGNEYFSVKVTYNPENHEWGLFYQSDDNAFIAPSNVSSWNQIGSFKSNSTYTNENLKFAGCLFNHNTAMGDNAFFDNIYLPFPEVNFEPEVAEAPESISGSRSIEVQATNIANVTAQIDLIPGQSTATNGTDVTQFTSQSLDFSSSKTQPFSIDPKDDNACEPSEYLTFAISNVSGARKGLQDSFRFFLSNNEHHEGALLRDFFDVDSFAGNWQNPNDWELNETANINGVSDLKHGVNGQSGNSYIYSALPQIDMEKDSTIWQMNLEKDGLSPSTSNRFWFYLTADESQLNSGTISGYSVGVNMQGNNDRFRLYKVKGGNVEKVLVSTENFAWSTSDPIGIRVSRSASGKWNLWYDDDGNGHFDNLKHVDSAQDRTYLFTDYCGLYTEYTSSRAGVLQMDDLEIIQFTCRTNYAWSGGGKGKTWNEGSNWENGLAPVYKDDTVVINDEFLGNDFKVMMYSSPSSNIGSIVNGLTIDKIRVEPGLAQNIELIRTKNTDLDLSAGSQALLLKAGALYEDQSNEGFPDLLNNGAFDIKDGGELLVNNQASIATSTLHKALSQNSDPGGLLTIRSQGQAISASGKSYPVSLALESGTSVPTYTTSGNNPFTIEGDLTIDSDVTYQSGMNGPLIVKGDFENQGTLKFNGDQVVQLNGSGQQNLKGPMTVKELEVANSACASLQAPVTVQDMLTLTNGNLDIGDHDLTINGSINGYGSGSYIRTSGKGVLKKTLTNTPDTFPIGFNPYLPVEIECHDCSSPVEFNVKVSDQVYNDPDSESGLQTQNVVGYTWQLTPSAQVQNVDVALQWPGSAEKTGFSKGSAHIGQWESGSSGQWGNQSTSVSGNNPYVAERQGMTLNNSDYYFGVGDNNSALPVELINFAANKQKKAVKLSWQTASEVNNSHFQIQRRGTSGFWETIGKVDGNGTVTTPKSYQYKDTAPLSATNYYRLMQVDLDGSQEFSTIRTVNFKTKGADAFQVFQTPEKAYWSVKLGEGQSVKLQLTDVRGRLVKSFEAKVMPGSTRKTIPDWEHLKPGAYQLILQTSQFRASRLLMKR